MAGVFSVARYSVIAAILASIAGQFLMLYVGSVKVFNAVTIYATKPSLKEYGLPDHLTYGDVAIALVIESIDAFLIALVLFYFAYGIYRLYLTPPAAENDSKLSLQAAPRTLGELKEVVAQVILVVLFVLFARITWLSLNDLDWKDLVLPISIALLALSIKLARFR